MKQSVARVTPLFQMCVRCTHSIIQKHTQSASHDTSYASMNRNRASKLTIDSEIRVTTNQLFSIRLHVYNGVHHLSRYGYERQRYRFHIRLWIWMWMRDLCVKSRFNSFFDMAFGVFLCSFANYTVSCNWMQWIRFLNQVKRTRKQVGFGSIDWIFRVTAIFEAFIRICSNWIGWNISKLD